MCTSEVFTQVKLAMFTLDTPAVFLHDDWGPVSDNNFSQLPRQDQIPPFSAYGTSELTDHSSSSVIWPLSVNEEIRVWKFIISNSAELYDRQCTLEACNQCQQHHSKVCPSGVFYSFFSDFCALLWDPSLLHVMHYQRHFLPELLSAQSEGWFSCSLFCTHYE